MRTVTGPGAIPQGIAPVAQSPLAGVQPCCTSAGHNRQLLCLQPRPSSMQSDRPQSRHSTSSKSYKR
eukprot:6261731-Amphidinium_carterae.1